MVEDSITKKNKQKRDLVCLGKGYLKMSMQRQKEKERRIMKKAFEAINIASKEQLVRSLGFRGVLKKANVYKD